MADDYEVPTNKDEMMALADRLENMDFSPRTDDWAVAFAAADLARKFAALEPVGTLCVFDVDEPDHSFEYDISSDAGGHARLSKMDGALLYAATVAEGSEQK